MDARDMQTLLERTAKVLEASGLILWVVNQERTSLLPVLTHGYSERVLLKLNALDVDAENVTSLSYRTVRPQTVPGTGPGTTSAIAVPLVTAEGCNGVLAAEVYETKPSGDVVALARLIAAQFATMINPCETTAAAHVAQA
jgi:GAF domain-containing protein